MEFRGTSGPWVAVPSSRGGDYIEQSVNYDDGQEVPDPIPCPGSGGAMSYSRTICQVHWSGTDEWRANARAIAAIPQMIEALGRALNAPRGTSGRIILEMADEEILRAALTAAVGE